MTATAQFELPGFAVTRPMPRLELGEVLSLENPGAAFLDAWDGGQHIGGWLEQADGAWTGFWYRERIKQPPEHVRLEAPCATRREAAEAIVTLARRWMG